MRDFYTNELIIEGTIRCKVGLTVLSKSSLDLRYYMVMIVYFKPRVIFGDCVFCEIDVPFSNDIILNIFLDSLTKSLELFKIPIDQMPLLINDSGINGIIARYRMEKNS